MASVFKYIGYCFLLILCCPIVCLLHLFGCGDIFNDDEDDTKIDIERVPTGNVNRGAVIQERQVARPSGNVTGIASPSSRQQQVFLQQTPNGVVVGGIEKQHAIISDDHGGLIVVIKEQTSIIAGDEDGDVAVRAIEETKILHITREAILRDPDNPDIRVISSTEVSGFNLTSDNSTQLHRALTMS